MFWRISLNKYGPQHFLYAYNTCGPWYLPWRMCSCHHPELRHWGSSLSLLHSAKFYCVSSVQSYLLSPHLHCIHITSTNTVYCTSSTLTCSHPQIVLSIYKGHSSAEMDHIHFVTQQDLWTRLVSYTRTTLSQNKTFHPLAFWNLNKQQH